jgi:hypothetical protein
MRKLTGFSLGLVILLSTTYSFAVLPIESFTICKGEYASSCAHATYHINCASSETVKAEKVCTVYGATGKSRVREYTKDDVSTNDGNRCGYTTWAFKCVGE